MRDPWYIGVIIVLIGFSMAVLEFYTQPRDCSKAATAAQMNGYIQGMRNTTLFFVEGTKP